MYIRPDIRRDLDSGDGMWAGTEVGRAASYLHDLRESRRQSEIQAGLPNLGRRERRRHRADSDRLAAAEQLAAAELEELADPVRTQLRNQHQTLKTAVGSLRKQATQRKEWLDQHPEAAYRLGSLDAELNAADRPMASDVGQAKTLTVQVEQDLVRERAAAEVEADLGMELEL
jgi:hypothetical protein